MITTKRFSLFAVLLAFVALLSVSCSKQDDYDSKESDCIKKTLNKYEDKFEDINGDRLYLYIMEEGEGDISMDDTVKIKYKGTALQKNMVFASNDTLVSPVRSLIKCWRAAFASNKIKHQSKGMLLVPYKYGFNDKIVGVVEPYSTLLFEFNVD